jgi:uncharacterized protein YecE (DUF72 family)
VAGSVKKINWSIGCSGFYYRHWRHIFYPEKVPMRLWFEFYCNHFKTVELNTTFYNFPKPEILSSWYKRSPQDFIFTVKAPRLITHYKKFTDCKKLLNDFYDSVQKGLQEKLGCVIFQLPPNIQYSEKKLDEIISSVGKEFTNVIEFRHASWWRKDVMQLLGSEKITFCGISYPKLPDVIIGNTPVLYYRLHGVPQLYTSEYTDPELKKVISQIQTFKNVRSAYLYFNNDSKGWAFKNALTSMKIAEE